MVKRRVVDIQSYHRGRRNWLLRWPEMEAAGQRLKFGRCEDRWHLPCWSVRCRVTARERGGEEWLEKAQL
jgi:hypothetical protein